MTDPSTSQPGATKPENQRSPKGIPRKYALTLIGIVTILLFLGVWAAILIQAVTAAQAGNVATIQDGLTVAGGTVSTLIASLTAAAIGFSIAEAKVENEEKLKALLAEPGTRSIVQTADQAVEVSQFKASDLADGFTPLTIAAILSYLLVGLAVLVVWLALDVLSPAIVSGFALSLIGWLVGAAGIVFEKGDD